MRVFSDKKAAELAPDDLALQRWLTRAEPHHVFSVGPETSFVPTTPRGTRNLPKFNRRKRSFA